MTQGYSKREIDTLFAGLEPLVARVRRDTCVAVRPGKDPARIAQPLTDVKVQRHLSGGTAYGVYPMGPGSSTTRVALLDMDSHRGETPWDRMQDHAAAILRSASTLGLLGVPFRSSGGAGIHIYFLFGEEQDAFSVRETLRGLLSTCGFKEGKRGIAAHEIEIFPAQSHVEPGKYGNMFVLPGARKSVPLDTFELEALPHEAIGELVWPLSRPVLVREQDKPSTAIVKAPANSAAWRRALDATPNSGDDELPYDEWFQIIAAIDYETEHSDEGLQIALGFNARSSKDDREFFENRVWPYLNPDRDRPVTGETIKRIAARYGWVEDFSDQFEVIETPASDEDKPWPKFLDRNVKTGAIPASNTNTYRALQCPALVPWQLGFDAFRDEIMRAPLGSADWVPFDDVDYPRLAMALEAARFSKVSHGDLQRVVLMVAKENTFDSAILWLNSLPEHDGVSRCETFLRDYLGAEDSPYTRAVSRYLWSGLAGRVLEPGSEAPMVPVLIGEQGAGKTRAVKALAPAIDFYCELNLADRDADASRSMRGRLVIELGELRGLHSRDSESIKAFISRTHENWIPKYREFGTNFARRFVFVGTTNQDEFLADDTGERRWLPVRVGRCDVDAIERDCLQLWAEARDTYQLVGADWRDAEQLARQVHAEHKLTDAWHPVIETWLAASDPFSENSESPGMREFLQVHEVAFGALTLDAKNLGKREEMRIGSVLRALGWAKARRSIGKKQVKVWLRPRLDHVDHCLP